MAVDVELIPLARRAVAEVRDPHDVAATVEERREQDAGERQPAPQPGGRLWVDLGPPVSTEPRAQGAVDRGAGPQRSADDDDEPDRRQDGQAEPDPADGRRDVTLGSGQ
jgi:hypothetical protein